MAETGRSGSDQHPRFTEDLIGLDPHDPEAQAFAEHLDRMEKTGPTFTIEACLQGMSDFADSSNRLGGSRWFFSAVLVGLIMLGVVVGAWDILTRLAEWLGR
jgi:hypothetical protein